MEGHSALCCSTEAIESVVEKLTEVMKISPMELQNDLRGLAEDVEKISVGRKRNLNKISDLTDEQVKVWMMQVKELMYELEDWQHESREGTSSSIGKPQRSWQISKFTALVNGARERYTRYGLLKKPLATDFHIVHGEPGHSEEVRIYEPSSKTDGTSSTDSPLFWGARAGLIGIDGPKKVIIKDHLENKVKMLTVVSIFGMEGIGKSTLAKAVYYGDFNAQFDWKASVFLGRSPSLKAILQDMLHQLKPHKVHGENRGKTWDLREVIVQLYEFLYDKR